MHNCERLVLPRMLAYVNVGYLDLCEISSAAAFKLNATSETGFMAAAVCPLFCGPRTQAALSSGRCMLHSSP